MSSVSNCPRCLVTVWFHVWFRLIVYERNKIVGFLYISTADSFTNQVAYRCNRHCSKVRSPPLGVVTSYRDRICAATAVTNKNSKMQFFLLFFSKT